MTATAHAATVPGIAPVRGQERLPAIDVLRGAAILGILIVNMGLFSMPDDVPARQLWPNAVDGTVDRLVLFLAQEKFKTLFSFLFGVGLAVQMMRAEARGARFLPLYARRLGVLFLIGIAHSLLLWDGDILHDYAQLGVVLLCFRHRSPTSLLVGAGACLAIPVVFYGFTTFDAATRRAPPRAVAAWISYETGADDQDSGADATRIYSRAPYRAMVAFRARALPRDLMPDSDDAYVFAIFLLGLYAGRRRLFHDVAAHRFLLRRLQRWGFTIGIAGNAAFAAGGAYEPSPTSVAQNLGRLCLVVGAPALTCAYAATITLLMQDAAWRRRLAPLARVGRTALSNYLLQSLICTTLFYGYGLGLFGKVRPSIGLLVTIAIFLIQVPLSGWWLRRFRFGPIEWLWRSLTYWRPQPLRVSET